MKPIITIEDIDDEMAIKILDNAIFGMSMIKDIDNQTLCIAKAMKLGVDALVEKIERKNK